MAENRTIERAIYPGGFSVFLLSSAGKVTTVMFVNKDKRVDRETAYNDLTVYEKSYIDTHLDLWYNHWKSNKSVNSADNIKRKLEMITY